MTIELRNLEVLRRRKCVLRDVNLNLTAPMTTLMGINGSGKSTLLAAIAGLLPSRGSISFDGRPVRAGDRVWLNEQMGFAPQSVRWPPRASVRGVCEIAAFLRRVPSHDVASAIDRALTLSGLSAQQHDSVGTLSGGQARRLTLAQALVHRPSFLVLDEPTSELDPAFTQDFADTVRHLIEIGHRFIMSTHSIDDVSMWGGDVVIVKSQTARHIPQAQLGEIPSDRATAMRSVFREGQHFA